MKSAGGDPEHTPHLSCLAWPMAPDVGCVRRLRPSQLLPCRCVTLLCSVARDAQQLWLAGLDDLNRAEHHMNS